MIVCLFLNKHNINIKTQCKKYKKLDIKTKSMATTTPTHYMHYNLYLDAPVNYSRLDEIKIMKIRENLPLTDKFLKYIETNEIKYLEFGADFNYPIDNLPPCVEHMFFHPASKFNHPLVNLPAGLKTLIIGAGYWETLEYLPCSLLFLGYHKSKQDFIAKFGSAGLIPLDEIINTSLPNLLYISFPCDVVNYIDMSSSGLTNGGQQTNKKQIKTKKILKSSSLPESSFIKLIEERNNLDYFMVHG